MIKFKVLLLIPVFLIFSGCAERGMFQPLVQHTPINTAIGTKSQTNTLQKNTVIAKSEVKKIEKDEKTFLDKGIQNIIAGTFVALIGLAMLI